MVQKKLKKIHFMGIGGSGTSGVAVLAKKAGYEIDGCDLQIDNPYIEKISEEGISIQEGHDKSHIVGKDLIVTTPAVLLTNEKHPEVVGAGKNIMTIQEFMGKYLQDGKEVIGIAGTHGKSSTTAMVSLLLEQAGFDPSVMVGGKIKEWNAHYRFGKGKYFVVEADEFYDNFLFYDPSIIILNIIEYDHPDYFKSELQMLSSFEKFILRLKNRKVLIVNRDSIGIKNVFDNIGKQKLKGKKIYGYTLSGNPKVEVDTSVQIEVLAETNKFTHFKLTSKALKLNNEFKLSIPGRYNVENITGAIILGRILNIDIKTITTMVKKFSGIGRRMELIGVRNGVKVYDDYAHHPTAIKVTLKALKQRYPENRLIAIVEPHMFSRTKTLLSKYNRVFDPAELVIIAPIFKSRDKEDFGISGESVVQASGHKNIKYIDNFKDIVRAIRKVSKKGDVVVVMGAGDSYLLAKDLLAKK